MEYTKVLMLAQLDLNYDTKQADNVCFDPNNHQQVICPIHETLETKESGTQTISRKWIIFFTVINLDQTRGVLKIFISSLILLLIYKKTTSITRREIARNNVTEVFNAVSDFRGWCGKLKLFCTSSPRWYEEWHHRTGSLQK